MKTSTGFKTKTDKIKKLISTIFMVVLLSSAFGQNADHKWSLGLLVGKTEYVGDLGNGFLDFVPHYASLELALNRYLSPSFDLGFQGQYGDYGYFKDYENQFLARKTDGILLLKYKLNNGYLLKESAWIAPYLAAGAGVANFAVGRELPGYTKERTNAGLAAFNGCPDRDGDGIQDSEDRCPNVKGLKEFLGCPDTDGDGIPDIDDKCPTVFGIKENKGCPEVKEEVKKVFDQALRGINFETNKDIIKPVSYPILDQVVAVMKNNPEYNLEINGHTDATGSEESNLDLSRRRAIAVKKYLTDMGIDASRMMARGFGESIPVDDNTTAAGRAMNRRVEFKVVF